MFKLALIPPEGRMGRTGGILYKLENFFSYLSGRLLHAREVINALKHEYRHLSALQKTHTCSDMCANVLGH